MKTAALFFVFTSLMLNLNAQKNITGEYYLQGVMETASGFKLNDDRYGSGKWSMNKDSIILNSKPSPGKDFKLANSITSTNKFSIIKIEDSNTDLYRFVYCRVKTATEDSIFSFENDGNLVLPFAADSIEFLSELCPERSSVFAIDKSPMIYTFNFQPWILEVFFNQTAFHFKDDYLEGKHPLLDDKVYRFEKEK